MRLEDLLPRDHPIAKLGDVLFVEKDTIGWHVSNSEKQYGDHHPIPVLTANRQFILGYMEDHPQRTYRASKIDPVIIFDQFTTASRWVDFPFRGKSAVLCVLKQRETSANLKFLYYTLQSLDYDAATHQQHWAMMSKLQIPLPSLEVQDQIVAILDAHSELAELQAERVRLLKLEKDVLLEKIFAPGEGFKFSLGGRSFDTADWAALPIEALFTMRGGGEGVSSDLWSKDPTVDNPIPVWNSGTRVSGYFSRSNKSGPSIFIAAIGDGSSGHVEFIQGDYFAGGLFNEFKSIGHLEDYQLHFAYLGIKRLQPYFLAERSGSSQKTFNWTQSKKRMIPQPELKDQQLISEYFREIDSRIKLEEERLQLLKTQSAVVLEAIFKN